LENLELARDLSRLVSERRQQELHLIELETSRGEDPATTASIPAARQGLSDLDARLGLLRQLIARLTITAPSDGIALPPPPTRSRSTEIQLASWTGTPLDAANRGAFLDTGTLICLVGRPHDLEAVAVADQSDVPRLVVGGRAVIFVPQSAAGPLTGTVSEIARLDADAPPEHLIAAGLLPPTADSPNRQAGGPTSYQVRIALEKPPAGLVPGAVGRARLAARPETIAARMVRLAGQTFRFGQPGDQ
jgi:hypothetical protein